MRDAATGPARYDGHADWYDTTFSYLGGASADLLGSLLGRAADRRDVCVDIGCGTGLHSAVIRSRGYTVIGVDLSADQLRIAGSRNPLVVQADARHLPIATGSVAAAVMTFIHTDVDGFAATVGEAARILRPGGRLICFGVHPAFVGAFVERGNEAQTQELRLINGYGNEQLQLDPTGRYPVRSRVGTHNLTLTTFLGAFLADRRLRLSTLLELDTGMRPWQPNPADGRIVPWNIAVIAEAVGQTDAG